MRLVGNFKCDGGGCRGDGAKTDRVLAVLLSDY